MNLEKLHQPTHINRRPLQLGTGEYSMYLIIFSMNENFHNLDTTLF